MTNGNVQHHGSRTPNVQVDDNDQRAQVQHFIADRRALPQTDALLASLDGIDAAYARSALRFTRLFPQRFRRHNEAELLSSMLDARPSGARHVSGRDAVSLTWNAAAWSVRHTPPLGLRARSALSGRPLPPPYDEWSLDRLAASATLPIWVIVIALIYSAISAYVGFVLHNWTFAVYWMCFAVGVPGGELRRRRRGVTGKRHVANLAAQLARYGYNPDGTRRPPLKYAATYRGGPPPRGSVSVTAAFLALQAFAGAAVTGTAVARLSDTTGMGWFHHGPGRSAPLGSAVLVVAGITSIVVLVAAWLLLRWMRRAESWWQPVPVRWYQSVLPVGFVVTAIWWPLVALMTRSAGRHQVALLGPLTTAASGVIVGCLAVIVAVLVGRFEARSHAAGSVGMATFTSRWYEWSWRPVKGLDYRQIEGWQGPPFEEGQPHRA
ncbi:MAG: hypothetical protein KA110_10050 [Acidimicrobiia bacterium]|nr:hypothetical protein [Acidimicrobiia bacterium]